MKLYVDSNVIISLIREEIGFRLRSLYSEAENFFKKAGMQNDTIIVSPLTISEICKITKIQKDDVLEILSEFGIKVLLINKQEINHTKFIELGLHYPDSLHAALAESLGCDAIITFNTKDFKGLNEIVVESPGEY